MPLTLTCYVQDTLPTHFDMSILHNKITERTLWYDVYTQFWIKIPTNQIAYTICRYLTYV